MIKIDNGVNEITSVVETIDKNEVNKLFGFLRFIAIIPALNIFLLVALIKIDFSKVE